jgi:hypothetical protein
MNHIDFHLKLKKQRLDWFNSLKRSFYYSLIVHLVFVILIQFFLGINFNSQVKIRIKKIKQFAVELKEIKEPEPKIALKGYAGKDTLQTKPEKLIFAGIEIDTTEIVNRYEENTLNVSILFPIGWIYFDNQVNNIIDGIIFMPGEESSYDRRLSVLIQVNTNKNLFNPRLYDSSFTYNGMTFYVSKPQITFQQVTQSIYVRTGTFKADFLIKCTSPNEVEFRKFQPVFFAMVRSFSAGY